MLLSLKWLQEYVDISDITVEALADSITNAGIEVDAIYKLSEATNCVVGHVLEKRAHPEADKLNICKVNLGDEVTQIVCGAPNVQAGQKVIVSKVGATLPGGIKIKKAKLRGEESNGMICSLKELGIENKFVPQEYQNGIYVLDEKAPVGMDAIQYLGFDDVVFDLKTLNRSDCLSLLGIAYEVATILDKEVKKPYGEVVPFSNNPKFKVNIQSKDCTAYYAKIIHNIKIKPSPQWMQSRLIASGIRPISNVVDITNFVMLELGQPLHAFDYNKFNSQQVLVRNAKKGESIITLDELKRDLLETDLLITNGKVPVALAGVMGGHNTEIDSKTTNVLLESAIFNPLTVRNTYKRLGLRSESSVRFEKQVDPERTLYALNRASQLLVELADAKIDDQISFDTTIEQEEKLINIKLDKINHVLGIKLSEKEVSQVLRRLQFEFVVLNGSFVVTVPSRRQDITIEEDLIEEIIRIHGYEKLDMTLPLTDSVGGLTYKQSKTREIRKILSSCGLNEVITYALLNPKNVIRFLPQNMEKNNAVTLLLPMSEERSVMRQGLLYSLIEVIQYNNARNINNLGIFEIGKKYLLEGDQPKEVNLVAGAITGVIEQANWQNKIEKVDFFYLKGILETMFERFNLLGQITFVQNSNVSNDFHNMRTASIVLNNINIGIIGQVHPNTQKEFDIKDTYVFELNIDEILNAQSKDIRFDLISKYPTISRDIAIVVHEDLSSQTLKEAIIKQGRNILKSVDVFDVYQGEHVEKNHKSIAFSLIFEDKEKTLTDDEVNKAYDRIIKNLEHEFKAILRQ